MSQERVQKILARAGIASRRQAEDLITEGVVTINGKIAKLGDRATWGEDAIKVSGKLITAVEAPVYFAFHKPKNIISMMSDPEGRPTLANFFSKVKQRLFPVGRLDFTSEGLLILTNDGKFAEELQRRDDIPKVYHVKVKGHPDAEMLSRLERGMKVEGRFIKPFSVRVREEYTQKVSVEIVMLGSGAFDVKSYCESKGYLVERIIRASIGHLTLHGMEAGEHRLLKKSQAEALLHQPELGMKKIEQELSAAKEATFARAKREVKVAERAEKLAEKTDRIAARVSAVREKKIMIAPIGAEGAARPRRSMETKLTRSGFGGERVERPARPVRDEASAERPRKSFGDRPERSERSDRPAARSGFGADRPRKSFGDRPVRTERSDRPALSFSGARPDRAERPARGGFGADRAERPAASSGFGVARPKKNFELEGAERAPSVVRSERPARSFGGDRAERPARTFGDRPERAKRGGFSSDRAERPARSFGGDRSAERPARTFGDRPERAKRGGFSSDRAERPARSFGGDRAERPARAPRSDSGFGVVKSARPTASAPRAGAERPARASADSRPAKRGRPKA